MHNLPDVMILCGGLGTRLREVTGREQKTLAQVTDKPFLHFLIENLAAQNCERFILCAGYQADKIRQYFDNNDLGVEIAYSIEDKRLGTGGAVANAVGLINTDHFFVLNGDSFCRIDFAQLWDEHKQSGYDITITASMMDDAGEYGLMEINESGRVIAFKEKTEKTGGYVNAGIYCFSLRAGKSFPDQRPLSLEKDIFPHAVKQGINTFITKQPFYDIGTPERFLKAREVLLSDE